MPSGLSLGLPNQLAIVHDVARRGIPDKVRKARKKARKALLAGVSDPGQVALIDAAIADAIRSGQQSPIPRRIHKPRERAQPSPLMMEPQTRRF